MSDPKDDLMDKVTEAMTGKKEKSLPHSFDPDGFMKVKCKFCGERVDTPTTPEQWDTALWGGRTFKLGCLKRTNED